MAVKGSFTAENYLLRTTKTARLDEGTAVARWSSLWARSTQTHYCGANQGKAEAAPQPAHGRAVCFITFLAKLVRKALEETCCCWTSSTRRCPDQRAERGVLYFTNPLFVFCALLAFMAAVEAWEAGERVRLHVRIKHLYVKECAFEMPSPESTGGDVQSGSELLTLEGLQGWPVEMLWETSVSIYARGHTVHCDV